MGLSTIAYQVNGKRHGKKKLLVSSERPISLGWDGGGRGGFFTIRIVSDKDENGKSVNAVMALDEPEARMVVKYFTEYLDKYGKEPLSGYTVQVRKHRNPEFREVIGTGMDQRSADKCKSGAMINLNHSDYYIQVVKDQEASK